MKDVPAPLRHFLQGQRERLHEAQCSTDLPQRGRPAEQLDRLLLASDYACERLCRQPHLLQALDTVEPLPILAPDLPAQWPGILRRYRHAEAVRLIHRDVNGIDSLDQTLAATSRLAEHCLEMALGAVHLDMACQHGVPRDGHGQAQRLVVFGLGKLGGTELNFSSDVDLVFAFPANGHSDGRRSLDNPAWFQRLGQRLIQLLAEIDAEGMVYRVDMRLRPFGQSGRLALSFAAMENYFQREGRDWERYAWIKARPVAGDRQQGVRFLEQLRPFIYRRYLDFGAIEGLREMKGMIEAEVQRKEREDDLKLGRGGIREIEFIVQLHQLIRGGREPGLRQPGLLVALDRLRESGHVPESSARRLESAYRFLRHLENRLQMLREEQTHALPADSLDRTRLAFGLGYPHWEVLATALESCRATVSDEFARVFEVRGKSVPRADRDHHAELAAAWRDPGAEDVPQRLVRAGFATGGELARRLRAFARQPVLATLPDLARRRLDRVLPQLLASATGTPAPDAVAERGLDLVQTILRRSSYLALLDERPAAMARLVDVLATSRWMAERLCAHPLLLDELLDVRADARPPTRKEVGIALQRALANIAGDDLEARIHALNEFRQGFAFRVARAHLVDGQPAAECTRQLAFVAEAVVGAVLSMAGADVARRYPEAPCDGLAAIAYGSFGGKELGFESDLDLVFLHDGKAGDPQSSRAMHHHTRVVRKFISLLGMPTLAGSLYEADLRLRPDGSRGLLVSSLEAFAAYQHERAWTWEQQALVRARPVAGDAGVMRAFGEIRAQVLRARREPVATWHEALAMRRRMRAELDRSRDGDFDLKQGEGGMVDLEFLLQAAVLVRARQVPAVIVSSRTPELIDALGACGQFDAATVRALRTAHDTLSHRMLARTLDAPAVSPDPDLDAARDAIMRAWQEAAGEMGGGK